MGIYHPRTGAGVVHYSSGSDLPAKKVWSWGVRRRRRSTGARPCRTTSSAVAEIQAGLYPQPGDLRVPRAAGIDPVHRVLADGAPDRRDLAGQRRGGAAREQGARGGRRPLVDRHQRRPARSVGAADRPAGRPRDRRGYRHADAGDTFTRAYPAARRLALHRPSQRRRRRGRDRAHGGSLRRHTGGSDQDRARRPTWVPPPAGRQARGGHARGRAQPGTRRASCSEAYATYEDGLARFPASVELPKRLGRLAVDLKRVRRGCRPPGAGAVARDQRRGGAVLPGVAR